jgi:hypothetical protein
MLIKAFGAAKGDFCTAMISQANHGSLFEKRTFEGIF